MEKIIFFTLLLLITPYASADWVYDSSNMVLDLNISSQINIVHLTSDYALKYMIVNLSFLPKESFNQEVLSLETEPEAEVSDSMLFKWEEPSKEKLDFRLSSKIKTSNDYKKIRSKIKFPVDGIPPDVLVYTYPSETIDSDNPEIISLASELAEGEDDMFVVVYKLAEWVKTNVNYDLSTLTADISQKASWVLNNKDGVCDEITNLFIALNRALGIPAKFVAGVVYSNAPEVKETWGPHGWAEVYFPGYGWVSFDVTFGEFGFINPTHIKLKESADGNDSSTKYQWLGHGIEIITEKLNIKTELKENTGKEEPKISFGIDVEKKNIGFGSYNLIEVTLENLKDYYLATELQLAKSREVKIIDEEIKNILLKPSEKKRAYWIIKLIENLDRRYVYTLPIAAISLGNTSKETKFSSSADGPVFSQDEIKEILKQKQEEEEKVYSRNMELDCSIDKREFYEYENATINCLIKNKGNVFLKELSICLEDECRSINIGINQERGINFLIKDKGIGRQEARVIAKNEYISKAVYVQYALMDAPKIEISDLGYPKEISFDDTYTISFILDKKSEFNPKKIIVTLNQAGFVKKWEISELNEDREFQLNLPGNELSSRRSRAEISISYKDDNNREYNEEKEFYIDVVGITIMQRAKMFVNKIEGWLSGLFS